MTITVPMTARGAEQLRQTLHELKSQRRPQITAAIAEARAHGDLKENAEYHAAKEEQGFVERLIVEFEVKLAHSTIIDPSKLTNTGKIVFGATVHLINVGAQDTVVYQIVGEDEANVKIGLLSINSPIARALIGKVVGDVVNVKTPAGEQSFEVTQIEYI